MAKNINSFSIPQVTNNLNIPKKKRKWKNTLTERKK